MIKETIEYISKKLTELNLFEKVYSLVEIVTDADGKSFPAVYSSNGKYNIIQYSLNNGTAYIRKNGNITLKQNEDDHYNSCSVYYDVIIPLNIVLFKKKSKLPIDCIFSEDVLAETIIFHFTNNVKDYKSTINSKKFSIKINSINTDSRSVWQNETEKIEQTDINYDIACVLFDVDVELLVDAKCLNNMCSNNG